MRSFFAFISLTLALVACAPAGSPQSEFPTVAVDMRPGLFEPTTISIKKEQKVCWVNNDTVDRWPASNIHPTHEIYSEFDPQRGLDPGETWCFVFDKPGIWKFHDHLLPELVGTVTVEE
jgi:plastocyanin